MNLSMVPALSTLRFAGVNKLAATPLAFSALAPAASDVFFASTVRFGKMNGENGVTWDAVNNQFLLNSAPIATVKNPNAFEGSVTVAQGKESLTAVAQPKGKNLVWIGVPGSQLKSGKFQLELDSNNLNPNPTRLSLSNALSKARKIDLVNDKVPSTPIDVPFVLMLAGLGTRLNPMNDLLGMPKPLVHVANGRPMVGNIYEDLIQQGFQPKNGTIVTLKQFEPTFQKEFAYLGDKNLPAENYLYQPAANGTAGVTNTLLESDKKTIFDGTTDQSVMFVAGDQAHNINMRHLYEVHNDKQADLTIATVMVPENRLKDFGIVETENLNESGWVTDFLEKPDTPEKLAKVGANRLASTFIFVVGPQLLKEIPAYEEKYRTVTLPAEINKWKAEKEAAEKESKEFTKAKPTYDFDFSKHVFTKMKEENQKKPGTWKIWSEAYKEPTAYWNDIGNPVALAESNMDIANGKVWGMERTRDAHNHVTKAGVYYDNTTVKAAAEAAGLKPNGPSFVFAPAQATAA